MKSVVVTAYAGLWGEEARAFHPRSELPERKHLKLMARGVRLGVAAVGRALAARPGWESIAPERRGLFVGSRPVGGAEDLQHALQASTTDGRVDEAAFGEVGVPLVHPLWLVKGLSNNIPGYACAYWDIRGDVANRCEGRVGGLAAVVEAARAVAEGRVDLAVAGGADCVLLPPPWATGPTGEGAAFVVLEAAGDGPELSGRITAGPAGDGPLDVLGDLGAATGPVRLVRALQAGEAATVSVGDEAVGLTASVTLQRLWCPVAP